MAAEKEAMEVMDALDGSRKRDRKESQMEGGEENGENGLKVAAQATDGRAPKRQRVVKTRSLFIRSLPPTATSESLTELVSQYFPVKHSTVVVDPKTKTSRGYGFVTLTDPEDTKEALSKIDKLDWEGRKLRAEIAEPRHRAKGAGGEDQAPDEGKLKRKQALEEARRPSKLIVRNLPWSIKTSDQLASLFHSFGKVKFADLPNSKGKLSGFGFVTFRRKKCAEKAVEMVNGKVVDGRTVAVDWAVDKAVWDKQAAQEPIQSKKESKQEIKTLDNGKDGMKPAKEKSVIQNNTAATADDDLEAFMKNHMGNLESEEEDEEEDDDDDNDDNEQEEEPMESDDERDQRNDGPTPITEKRKLMTDNSTTVFVRNLPYTTTDDDLKAFFEKFGPVRYARVVVDRTTGRAAGTGFVCFLKQDDAKSCVKSSPRPQAQASSVGLKQSVLEDEKLDPSGSYTFDGRILHVVQALSKDEATRFAEGDGKSKDKDKRRLFLLSEGSFGSDSPLYALLTPSEIQMRKASLDQRKKLVQKNPTLHLSLTRLAVRNIPRNLSSKELKQLARQAVVGFAADVKEGLRQPLSQDEKYRGGAEAKEAEHRRKLKGEGVVKQAKIVFETKDGAKMSAETDSSKSRGYGFIEYSSHRWALMGLRWLNGHQREDDRGKKQRLLVEFAIENAQVVKRRKVVEGKSHQETRSRTQNNTGPHSRSAKDISKVDRRAGQKAKADAAVGQNTEADKKGDRRKDLEQKLIARKRMVRKKKAQFRGKA